MYNTIHINQKFIHSVEITYRDFSKEIEERAFLSACVSGTDEDKKIIFKYIKAKKDVTISNNLAIIWACEMGHTDIVKALVKAGADISGRGGEVLQACIINHRTDLQEFLLKKKCAISKTSIKYACIERQPLLIEYLIKNKAPYDHYLTDLLKSNFWDLVEKAVYSGCPVSLVEKTARENNYSFNEYHYTFLKEARILQEERLLKKETTHKQKRRKIL